MQTDKEGNIHAAIAKTNFDAQKLEDNLVAFIRALNDIKPKSVSNQVCAASVCDKTRHLYTRIVSSVLQLVAPSVAARCS